MPGYYWRKSLIWIGARGQKDCLAINAPTGPNIFPLISSDCGRHLKIEKKKKKKKVKWEKAQGDCEDERMGFEDGGKQRGEEKRGGERRRKGESRRGQTEGRRRKKKIRRKFCFAFSFFFQLEILDFVKEMRLFSKELCLHTGLWKSLLFSYFLVPFQFWGLIISFFSFSFSSSILHLFLFLAHFSFFSLFRILSFSYQFTLIFYTNYFFCLFFFVFEIVGSIKSRITKKF